MAAGSVPAPVAGVDEVSDLAPVEAGPVEVATVARVVAGTATGQTVVVAGTTTVTTPWLRAGQLVTVGAQLMTVEYWVSVTVLVAQTCGVSGLQPQG